MTLNRNLYVFSIELEQDVSSFVTKTMLMVLRQWNTNIICWPWNPTSWNFILERDRFGSLPISLSNHMKTNAIKNLHYEWNLKIVSKLRELLGENKVNKFSNITSSQILNCARVHRIDRVLHNWEKNKQTRLYQFAL